VEGSLRGVVGGVDKVFDLGVIARSGATKQSSFLDISLVVLLVIRWGQIRL